MESQENLQPAVLIGGPPHAGKSVLTYSLTRALRQYGIAHYVIRATPDGEGHWSQETPQQVREVIRRKGAFSDLFLRQVCADIERRQLPFLVDVGGLPQGEQFQIFRHCTHAILLRHHSPAATDWHSIVQHNRLHLLADLLSDLDGTPALETRTPVLRGVLTGLRRGATIGDEPFDSLVARLVALFALTTTGLSELHTKKAPTDLVLNLPQLLDRFVPGSLDWHPQMLPRLLQELPVHTPLSAYGRAPHWVYTAIALHTAPAPFYQFDARLGWLCPLPVRSGSAIHPEITFKPETQDGFVLLHCHLHNQNLDYSQLGGLNVPALPAGKGVVLSGKLPLWLSSALGGLYHQLGHPWIAGYYPQRQGAVVVSSRVANHAPGDLIPIAFIISNC